MAGGQLNGKAWKENYRPQRMTAAEFLKVQSGTSGPNKFNAVSVQDPDHGRFDSKREHNRFHLLRLREHAKEIRNLKRQVPYMLNINGHDCGRIVMDFTYDEYVGGGWVHVDEDCKGFQTPLSKFQHKVFAAIFGREIRLS